MVLGFLFSSTPAQAFDLCERDLSTVNDPQLRRIIVTCRVAKNIAKSFAIDEYQNGVVGAFPYALDSAAIGACSLSNLCFDNVMPRNANLPLREWAKTDTNEYTHLPTGDVCTYNSVYGSFVCQ